MELRRLQTFVTYHQTERKLFQGSRVLGYTSQPLTVQIRLLENRQSKNCLTRLYETGLPDSASEQFWAIPIIIRDIKCARNCEKRRSCAAPFVQEHWNPCVFELPDTIIPFIAAIPGSVQGDCLHPTVDMVERNNQWI